jgi:hypothetical protein
MEDLQVHSSVGSAETPPAQAENTGADVEPTAVRKLWPEEEQPAFDDRSSRELVVAGELARRGLGNTMRKFL